MGIARVKQSLLSLVKFLALCVCCACLGVAAAEAAWNVQAPQLDGAQIIAKIPAQVWIFLSGVFIAIGVQIEQSRRLRSDVAGLKKDLASNRLHLDDRLDRHRGRLEDIEVNIVRVEERVGIHRKKKP